MRRFDALLFKAQKLSGANSTDKGKGIAVTPVIHRQHHRDLVRAIMPLLAPLVPPGFPPKFVVAPEVFEQMQLYMDYTNPEERRIREFKMKMTLRDLSSNPGAQSSYLRHEDHPRISGVQNKNLGRVFDFRMAETDEVISSAEGGMTHKALIPREPIQSALLPVGRSFPNGSAMRSAIQKR